MRIRLVLVVLFIGIYLNSFAQFNLGETVPPDFYGRSIPFFKMDLFKNKIIFEEQKILENFFINNVSHELNDLSDFLNENLIDGSLCSNEKLSSNLNYFRYLNRLMTLSYLYELIQNNRETLLKLGINNHSCDFSWPDFLDSCQSKTLDMSKFISRSKKLINSINL